MPNIYKYDNHFADIYSEKTDVFCFGMLIKELIEIHEMQHDQYCECNRPMIKRSNNITYPDLNWTEFLYEFSLYYSSNIKNLGTKYIYFAVFDQTRIGQSFPNLANLLLKHYEIRLPIFPPPVHTQISKLFGSNSKNTKIIR